MRYEKPETIEIKMDAEIGSYQNDFDAGDLPGQPVGRVEHGRTRVSEPRERAAE